MVILCVGLTGSQSARIWSNIIPVKLDSQPGGEGVLNEINIWISSLSKADYLFPCGWDSFNQLKTKIEQKVGPFC